MNKNKSENLIAGCSLAGLFLLMGVFFFANNLRTRILFAVLVVATIGITAVIYCSLTQFTKNCKINLARPAKVICTGVLTVAFVLAAVLPVSAAYGSASNVSVLDDYLKLTYSSTGSGQGNLSSKDANAAVSVGDVTTDAADTTLKSTTLTIKAKQSTHWIDKGTCSDTEYFAAATVVNITIKNENTYSLMFSSAPTITFTDANGNDGTNLGSIVVSDFPENNVLGAGQDFTITVTADAIQTTLDTQGVELTATVSFSAKNLADNDVTLIAPYGGFTLTGVKLDGTTTELTVGEAAQNTAKVPVGTVITMPTAAEVDNHLFYGWRLSNGQLLQNGGTFTVSSNVSVAPVYLPTSHFSKDGTTWKYTVENTVYTGPFLVGTTPYLFWVDAMYAAKIGSDKTVVLAQDYSLPALLSHNAVAAGQILPDYMTVTGNALNYVVPKGVTFLVPFDTNNTVYRAEPTAEEVSTAPTIYRTLTLGSGRNIHVNGEMSISAKLSASFAHNGKPFGDIGFVQMHENSNITVNNAGTLYVWGIIAGSAKSSGQGAGTVTVNSGGTVYECFQVGDWRGGDGTSDMIDNSNRVFPVSQYYIQSIQIPITLYSGAKEYARMPIAATVLFQNVITGTNVPLIGGANSGCMFQVESGSLIKDYDEDTDRCTFDVKGNLTMSSLILGLEGSYLNSSNYVLPITNNLNIIIRDGYTATIGQDMALLPGAVMEIEENATLKIGSGYKFIVYDRDPWMTGYVGASNVTMAASHYAYDRPSPNPRGTAQLVDAKIIVNGTLDATQGKLYTTTGGGNICSTKTGAVMFGAMTAPSTTPEVTYQATQSHNGVSYDIEYSSIDIYPAWLNHEDSTYVQPGYLTVATTYNYDHYICCDDTEQSPSTSLHGKWYAGTHSETENTVDPTCSVDGYIQYNCSCEHIRKVTTDPMLGHTVEYDWSTDYTTCTASITCSFDSTHNKEATTSLIESTTTATCTQPGVTTYTATFTDLDWVSKASIEVETGINDIHSWNWSEGKCTACSELAVRYDAILLSIDAEIQLKMKFYIHNDLIKAAGAKVVVTEEGNNVVGDDHSTETPLPEMVSETSAEKGTRYVASEGIAAGEMTGDVTVQFKVGDTVVKIYDEDTREALGSSLTKSVVNFAQAVAQKSGAPEIALCEGALTFGSYAQVFYGTDKDRNQNPQQLAYEAAGYALMGLEEVDQRLNDEIPPTSVNSNTEVTATTQKLNLDSSIYIRTYFKLPDGITLERAKDTYKTITITRPTENGKKLKEEVGIWGEENGRFYVDILNVPPAYWDNTYTITIYQGETVVCTVNTSVLAWCARCVQASGASDTQKDMARAMYLYCQAANTYFEQTFGYDPT